MDVLFWSSGENHFVFQADKDILVEYILEDIMNQNLEHGRDIGETKGHEKIFIVACGSVWKLSSTHHLLRHGLGDRHYVHQAL